MNTMLYILDDNRQTIPVDDPKLWTASLAEEDRIVAEDTIGDSLISTVFIGLDYSMIDKRADYPCIFNTLILNGAHDGKTTFMPSWKTAQMMHRLFIDLFLKKGDVPKQRYDQIHQEVEKEKYRLLAIQNPNAPTIKVNLPPPALFHHTGVQARILGVIDIPKN